MKVPLTFVLISGPDDKSGINQSCKPPSSFKCEECGSKFTAAVSLKRHKERVHDKSNQRGRHVCTHCSKAFHDKQDWSRHEKTHTSVKSGQSLKLCFVNERTELLSTVKHRNNGHRNTGMHQNNGRNPYDGDFYVVDTGKIHVSE